MGDEARRTVVIVDVRWLGRMDYLPAWELQRETHAAVVAGDVPDTLLLVEHEGLFTAGRRTDPGDRPPPGSNAIVVDVDRGGKITWHGPGQLTGYPIVRLPPMGSADGQPARDGLVDVVAFVRRLEGMLIEVCAELGVDGVRVEGRSGVWVQRDGRPDAKVAAIGVRVSRGVTMHGFALNANCDLTAYDAIVPCGLPDATVTSLTELLGRDVGLDEVRSLVVDRADQLAGTAARSRGMMVP